MPHQYTCEHCRRSFSANRTKARFCSHDCSQAFRTARAIFSVCPICDKRFRVPSSCRNNKSQPCCSQACRIEVLRQTASTGHADSKRCARCGIIKSRSEYYESRSSNGRIVGYCKECERAKSRKHTHERTVSAQQFVRRTKALNPCQHCGESENVAIDFHHIDPSKKTKWLWQTKSLDDAIAELQHCASLCANCHRKFHAGLIHPNLVPVTLADLEG